MIRCLHYKFSELNSVRKRRGGKSLPLFSFSFLKNIFKRFYLLLFRQRGRVGERVEEKHQCVVASCAPPTGDLARNPGMCPDWESNQVPFGLQASAQSTEPHQSGLLICILITIWLHSLHFIVYKQSYHLWRWLKCKTLCHKNKMLKTLCLFFTVKDAYGSFS